MRSTTVLGVVVVSILALLTSGSSLVADPPSVSIGLDQEGIPTADFDFVDRSRDWWIADAHNYEVARLLVASGRALPTYIDGDRRKGLNLTNEDVQHVAAFLRGQYPYRSFRRRLSYEQRRSDRPSPQLSEAARARLQRQDKPSGWASRDAYNDGLRAASLAMLHSENVRQFITQEGFGIRRFSPPGPVFLTLLEEPDATRQESLLQWSGVDGPLLQLLPGEPPDELLVGGKWRDIRREMGFNDWTSLRSAALDAWAREQNPLAMPVIEHLTELHDDYWQSFASRKRNGHVKDLDHVAGFAPHAAADRPFGFSLYNGEEDRSKRRRVWVVRQVNLVSLLKFNEPRVYISDQLPKMEELRNGATRRLDERETDFLRELQSGEDIVIDSRLNRIRMMGAVRAARRCLDCHEAQHGELLGAFVYDIVRKQPRPVRSASLVRQGSIPLK